MTDLEMFVNAMDGDWVVVAHESEGGKIRVRYRSLGERFVEWSHTPLPGQPRFPVGTVGRIGFCKGASDVAG